jgi:carbamoyl-phosphate synthase small subunit
MQHAQQDSHDRPGIFARGRSVFRGRGFGAVATMVGEAVFNTSMTGYQEILTDPSYNGQIVTDEAPQIGNYGVNPEDVESDGPKVAGFVVRDLSPVASNWRSRSSLNDYLAKHGIPGVTGVDTRSIAKKLRVVGALKSCISTEAISDEEAVRRAREWPGLVGVDYVKEVTTRDVFEWDPDGSLSAPFTSKAPHLGKKMAARPRAAVVAYDYGAMYKHPAQTESARLRRDRRACRVPLAAEVRKLKPQGVFRPTGGRSASRHVCERNVRVA